MANQFINLKREEIILKGYANKSDIAKFIPCCSARAKVIFDEITEEAELEGKINIENKILVKRLYKYVGLTENKILDFADRERKIKSLSQHVYLTPDFPVNSVS